MAEDSPTSRVAAWRVLTWNIRGWARPDLAAVAEVITGLRPDVAVVEEIQRRQVHRLAAALGWRFAWTRKHYPYSPLLWWRAEGLAILTPHAIGGVWRQTISPGVGTWTYRHRVLLAATVTRTEERLRVYGTHLAAHSEADERIAQARRVADRVAHDDAPLRVVAGDLNADQEVEVIRELHAVGLRDPGSDSTHPAHAPHKRYDYVLIPADAEVVESYVPDGGDHWADLSDHLPLLVEFETHGSDVTPMSLQGVDRRHDMSNAEIDGVPIWYEEHGDPGGPPLVALHGGILTFQRSFGDVLPWLTEGRRVIGVELQGHGHTPDTGRAMSIDQFADDVAQLIDRHADGGPVDVWGFSLGALTATALAVRHPAKVRRLVLAASHIRPDGYHPEITAPEQDDPRLPTEQEFDTWRADYESVAPVPADFFPFLERLQPVVHDFAGWTADEIRSINAPTLLVIGDRDFVRLDHAAEMLDLFPDCRLAVLPATRHTEVMQRSDELRALVHPFLT